MRSAAGGDASVGTLAATTSTETKELPPSYVVPVFVRDGVRLDLSVQQEHSVRVLPDGVRKGSLASVQSWLSLGNTNVQCECHRACSAM